MYITIKNALAKKGCAAAAAVGAAAGLACIGAAAIGAQPDQVPQARHTYGLGTNITAADLAQFTSPMPDGQGLPAGSGTVMQGKKVYTQQCLACHGAQLQGGIGDRLIGGRGTLAEKNGVQAPIKTVESYWPYSTTLFDYIKRAMPFNAPGSLSNDDVYAVSAYLLSQAHIIPEDATLDQNSLPKVVMPNHDGFIHSDR